MPRLSPLKYFPIQQRKQHLRLIMTFSGKNATSLFRISSYSNLMWKMLEVGFSNCFISPQAFDCGMRIALYESSSAEFAAYSNSLGLDLTAMKIMFTLG